MRRFRVTALAALMVGAVLFMPMHSARAACEALLTDKGQDTSTISIEKTGSFTVWLRMWMPTNDSNSVMAKIDDQCPVVVGGDQSGVGFRWVQYGRLDLAGGAHTVILSGHEVGAGVDRVLAAADPGCQPTGNGDNCLGAAGIASPTVTVTDSGGKQETKKSPALTTVKTSPLHMVWLSSALGLAVLATGGLVLWRHHFRRPTSIIHAMPGEIVIAGRWRVSTRFLHILRHPKLVIGTYIVLMIVALTVAIAAADTQPVFEAEAGKLAGGAKIESNADASGGKYVSFQKNPAGSNTTSGGSTASGGVSGSTGGSSTSGGSSSGGGSSSNTSSSSCALPKYPKPSCTGVPSGVTLTTHSGNYNATTNGEVIDAVHITGDVIILANNVTIKNSVIDGTIYNDQGSLHGSFTVTDTTIGPASGCIGQPAINDSNYVARRVRSRGHDDGFRIGPPGNVQVYDSYVDNCYLPPEQAPPDGSHSDGVQAVCGGETCANVIITHNTFDGTHVPTTNMLNLTDTDLTNVTATDNLMAGGGYTVDAWWHSGPVWTINNNRFVNNSWAYGAVTAENTCSHQSWSGNTLVTIDSDYAILSTVGPQGCIE